MLATMNELDTLTPRVTRIALKDLLGRKLRLVLTSLAIVMGVAMVSGTYVLTDTINAAFSSIFTTAYSTSDAVVTGQGGVRRLAERPVLPGVDARPRPGAARRRRGRRRDRRPGAVRGAQRQGALARRRARASPSAWSRGATQRFNPLNAGAGSWPVGTRRGRGRHDHRRARARRGRAGRSGCSRAAVGNGASASPGSSSSGTPTLGGATLAIFDLPTAQALFHKQGELDQIDVAAKPGVAELGPARPDPLRTAAAHAGAHGEPAGEARARATPAPRSRSCATSCSPSAGSRCSSAPS